jgi:hypothetical protein
MQAAIQQQHVDPLRWSWSVCVALMTTATAAGQQPGPWLADQRAQGPFQPPLAAPVTLAPPPPNAERGMEALPPAHPTLRPLGQLSYRIQPREKVLPQSYGHDAFAGTWQSRQPPSLTLVGWEAPGLSHKTLYFQDLPLERNGFSCHPLIQPGISAMRFYADIGLFPLKFCIFRCREEFALGYTRPGTPPDR